jgi:hypothetical protein
MGNSVVAKCEVLDPDRDGSANRNEAPVTSSAICIEHVSW